MRDSQIYQSSECVTLLLGLGYLCCMGSLNERREERITHLFEACFRRQREPLRRAALARLSHAHDAEDAVAEVFVQLWRHRDDGSHVFGPAWLKTALHHVIGNVYRSRQREARRIDAASRLHVEELIHSIDDALVVRGAIRDLSSDDRLLLWMAYWNDLSHAEISESLGIRSATTRVRLFRARARLQGALGLASPPPPPKRIDPS